MWNLLSVLLAVGLLTVTIAWGKVQPLLAFIVAAIVAALMLGMPAAKIPGAIEKGIGDLLGSLVVVICLGAVFGKPIADSGAARRMPVPRLLQLLFGGADKRTLFILTHHNLYTSHVD